VRLYPSVRCRPLICSRELFGEFLLVREGFCLGGVAIDSADVVLTKSDPLDVVRTIEISRAALRKMHQNLFWAIAYNAVAFPLAAGVLYPILLRPEVAALATSGSTVLVAGNALLLKRFRTSDLLLNKERRT